MTTTDLKASVDVEASLHLPDLIYNQESNEHSLKFDVLPLSSMLSSADRDIVGLQIKRKDETFLPYVFSKWSRSQLLTLMGTREKWFSRVPLVRQADELNARLHTMNSYNFRTMRVLDDELPIRFVRGLVSSEYADIPNTEIMDAIVAKAPPNSMALRAYSGISDRAFYAYIIIPSPITIPNTKFFAYPAIIVKNSEVGYTSLYVIPGILIRRWAGGSKDDVVPAILESRAVLKKIHRGKIDLSEKFQTAFNDCAAIWSDMTTKMPLLASKLYASEDAAIHAMSGFLVGASAQADFVKRCSDEYKKQTRTNTALDIVEVISSVCAAIDDRDEQYIASSIAGAVLYKLM